MRKVNIVSGFVVMVFLAVSVALAQGPPTPGPEQKRIGYFEGRWTVEGDMKPGPFGPGGKTSSNDTCEWFAGGFHLVCRMDAKSPMGDAKATGVWGYNPSEKAYTYYTFSSAGFSLYSKGNVEGDTWSWLNDIKMGPTTLKSRFSLKEVSRDSYTFKWETSVDGNAWTTMQEGKGTRVK